MIEQIKELFNSSINSPLSALSKYFRELKITRSRPLIIVSILLVSIIALLIVLPAKKDEPAYTSSSIQSESSSKADASTLKPAIEEKERLFHTIKSGETLGTILDSYGFSHSIPYAIVNTENGDQFKRIRIGKTIELVLHKQSHELEAVRYPLSKLDNLLATIHDSNVTVEIEQVPHTITEQTAQATINHSLFGAAAEAGINSNLIMETAEIFGWDIDFIRDIRTGDSFKIVYEQYTGEQGEVITNGNILSAEFINKGEKFTAIRYQQKNGEVGYFAPDGSSMKGTFLKSPMRFSRISSGFSLKRFHPILKKWRSHKGVDYAARTGTAIRSVANGRVIVRGRKGGYGRTVILSHGGKYTTLYAHLSKYNSKVRSGSSVKQGQVIGYVGSSGLATGPHLHYEFRVNGVHRNPLTYKTPCSR